MITMTIKGTPSYSANEFREYLYHRNKAFQTFDYQKIREVQMRYGIETQAESKEFWEYVARSVLEMPDATDSARTEALVTLDELGIH